MFRYTALPGLIKKSSLAQVYNRPWEVWWLNDTAPDCCPAVLGSNPSTPQPTAGCQSPGGLPPGMALGCGLTSVRGNRGENYKNESLVRQKHKKKNLPSSGILYVQPSLDQVKNALAQVQYTSLSGTGICTSLPGSGIQPSLDQLKSPPGLRYTTVPGRCGGSMVQHQTVVLQSWVHIRCLPSPQLTANLLVGCHLAWHLAVG